MNAGVYHVGPVRVAVSSRARVIGLIGQGHVGSIPLYFPRCSAIHTFFMRMAVDIVCLDRAHKIVKIEPSVGPWRIVLGGVRTRSIFEFPAGYARRNDLRIDMLVEWEEFERA